MSLSYIYDVEFLKFTHIYNENNNNNYNNNFP